MGLAALRHTHHRLVGKNVAFTLHLSCRQGLTGDRAIFGLLVYLMRLI